MLKNARLFMLILLVSPWGGNGRRPFSGPAAGFLARLDDVPAHHHGVVLMHHVVAMHGVAALHVAEAHEDADLFAVVELDHVLAGEIDASVGRLLVRRWRHAVAREDTMLLEVDVHRMAPRAAGVLEDPDFLGLLRRIGAHHVLIEELPVHHPGAVSAL